MSIIENFQSGGWSAVAVASETSQVAAVRIIISLELNTDYCDEQDWIDICDRFCGVENLDKLISFYSPNNQ